MNIKVITRHAPSNYGSLLQAMATIKVIEGLGHQCEIIDYRKKNEMGIKGILTSLENKPSWKNNWIKKYLYIALRYPEEKIASIRFEKMRSKYLKMTPRCYSLNDLKKLKADIFLTGSDQVWAPLLDNHIDKAYFLTFASSKSRKISYAASFGRTDFTEAIIDEYKEMLAQYDAITVREDSAVKLLHHWNIACKGQMLDPTLLLDSQQWNKYIEKDIKGEYVLIYEIHNNPNLDDYAKHFAKHVGLPLIRVTPSLHQISRGGKMIFCPKLGTFLSYIKNARYIITDSFHGTAFAINFNKDFIEILPNNQTGSRNQSILQLTGLQNRIITDYKDFSLANKKIDYISVNEIIKYERDKSINLLYSLINDNSHTQRLI